MKLKKMNPKLVRISQILQKTNKSSLQILHF